MNRRPKILLHVSPELRRLFFDNASRRALDELGEVVQIDSGIARTSAELARLVPGVRVLVTAWGCPPLTDEVLDSAGELGLVAHAGGTSKPFVGPKVFRRGIVVSQATVATAPAVAEMCLTLTLVLLRRVHTYDRMLRSGAAWAAAKQAPLGLSLSEIRVGVIGIGRIGREYVRLVRALGSRIAVYDPYLDAEEAASLGVERVSLDELLRSCHVVTLHAAPTTETRHMIARRQLQLMPDGAILVNTASSWLVDETALLDELKSGRISAGLDVFDTEPLPATSPFRVMPNVVLTPHEAGSTRQARRAQGRILVEEIRRFLGGKPLEYAITHEQSPNVA